MVWIHQKKKWLCISQEGSCHSDGHAIQNLNVIYFLNIPCGISRSQLVRNNWNDSKGRQLYKKIQMSLALLNFWCVCFLSYYSQGKTLWLDSWLHHCLRCHLGLITPVTSWEVSVLQPEFTGSYWGPLLTLRNTTVKAADVNRERTFPVFLSLKHKFFRVPTGESPSQMHPTSTVWKPQIAAKKLQLEGKVVRSTWNICLGVNSDIWRVDSIDPGKDWDCYFQFTNTWVLCQGKETVKSLPLSSLYP